MTAKNMEIARQSAGELSVVSQYTAEQVALIKSQIAPQATDDELKLFLYVAKQRGLDPLARQIYAIHRKQWNSDTRQEAWKMTIQTGIDGFRSVADRTGTYAPGSESWADDASGLPTSATVTVRKLAGGAWLEFAATAHWSEYCPMYKDKPGAMWLKMPHTMLAKCAEAKALRKGWPDQLGGLYVTEEMQQADAAQDKFEQLPQEVRLPVPENKAPVVVKVAAPRAAERKATAAKLPPVPERIAQVPAWFAEYVTPIRELAGVTLADLKIDELELLKDECAKLAHRVAPGDWKSWSMALAADAALRIQFLNGDLEVPPPEDREG